MIALVRADILKLVKRRGLMITAAILVVGLPLIVLVVAAIGRSVAPDTFGEYGGADGYEGFSNVTGFALFVTTILLGGVAGSMDESRGVFRDLAATGASRMRLGLSRIPAVVAVIVPLGLISFGLAVAVGGLAAGSEPMPSTGAVARDTFNLLVAIAVYASLSVGLSALTGSLAISLTVLFTWSIIIEPILSSLSFLGDARRVLLSSGFNAITRPEFRFEEDETFGMSTAVGFVVLAVWAASFAAAGVWRVTSRET